MYKWTKTTILEEVLIDTQWNVNMKGRTEEEIKASVLIDTQWNVNLCQKSHIAVA